MQIPSFKIILFFVLITANSAFAQSWDFGVFAGGAGYMGDLNPVNPLKINNLAFGGQIKRCFDPYWSLKFSVMHGKIEADDANSSNAYYRERNLRFYSPITEISLQTEFNFFNYVPSISKKLYTPFLFVGLGLVSFNPKEPGTDLELRIYQTEGQVNPYRSYAITMPIGFGFKYNIASKWSLIAEAGYRTPFIDYIDDVSGQYPSEEKLLETSTPNDPSLPTRRRLANPSSNPNVGGEGVQRGDYRKRDTYMFVGLSITYSIFKNGCPVVGN